MNVAWQPSLRSWPGSRQSTISRSSAFRTAATAGLTGQPTTLASSAEERQTKRRVWTGQSVRAFIRHGSRGSDADRAEALAAARSRYTRAEFIAAFQGKSDGLFEQRGVRPTSGFVLRDRRV